ncbi:hypothetical protein EC988_003432 [Linderina pennispora]|nr:hypothetical protein EC988_003432 [Linderina pennispora]
MRLFNRKGKGAQSQGSPKPPQPPQPPPPLGYAPPHTSSFQQPAEPFKPLPTLDVSLELPDLPSTSIVFDQPSQPATQPDPAPEQSLAELNALATMQQAPSRKNTVQSDYDFLLNIEESLDPIDPKAMLEMQLREQFGRPHSNTIGSSNGGGDYQVAMAPVEPPGQFAPEPAQPRPLVHPLVQAQAQPMVQVQARVQPMVPPPAARKPVAVSAAAAMAQHATTVSGNNAMEATDVIERQFAISRSSRGSSSPTSSDEEAMVTLTKQAATMTLTSGKPEPSSDPNRKITDRAANIQRMREASAMGKNMAFGMVHTGNGAGGFGGNADDESDSVPLGGLRRAAGTTTGQQSGSATAMIPQQGK